MSKEIDKNQLFCRHRSEARNYMREDTKKKKMLNMNDYSGVECKAPSTAKNGQVNVSNCQSKD